MFVTKAKIINEDAYSHLLTAVDVHLHYSQQYGHQPNFLTWDLIGRVITNVTPRWLNERNLHAKSKNSGSSSAELASIGTASSASSFSIPLRNRYDVLAQIGDLSCDEGAQQLKAADHHLGEILDDCLYLEDHAHELDADEEQCAQLETELMDEIGEQVCTVQSALQNLVLAHLGQGYPVPEDALQADDWNNEETHKLACLANDNVLAVVDGQCGDLNSISNVNYRSAVRNEMKQEKNKPTGPSPEKRCFFCGSAQHFFRECPDRRKGSAPNLKRTKEFLKRAPYTARERVLRQGMAPRFRHKHYDQRAADRVISRLGRRNPTSRGHHGGKDKSNGFNRSRFNRSRDFNNRPRRGLHLNFVDNEDGDGDGVERDINVSQSPEEALQALCNITEDSYFSHNGKTWSVRPLN
jgi:hypothetical protein